MTNLSDLPADSKYSGQSTITCQEHLTRALNGVVMTLYKVMNSPRLNDFEIDEMTMIVMALQRSASYIEEEWPDCDQKADREMAVKLGFDEDS